MRKIGPKEISAKIEKELGGDLSISNPHNCDLTKCLVKPKRREMRTIHDERQEFWVVLEEHPKLTKDSKLSLTKNRIVSDWPRTAVTT